MKTAQSENVHITILKKPVAVYEYAADPVNLPKWAEGLSKSALVKEGDFWVADSPMGRVKIKFTPKNQYGILDHDVILPNGIIAHNPMRVVKNHEGSEVIFTVFRQEGMSEENFIKDVDAVKKDLKTLKNILERS